MDTDRHPTPSSDRSARPVLQQFDYTASESVSAAVVRAVGAVSNEPLTELPPLYDVVDPDALDRLVADDPYSPAQTEVNVAFTFDDYFVRVTSTGTGYVCPADPDPGA